MQLSLANADKAMEVAGHIQVVSEQIHYLTECVAGPLDAEPSGRHHAMGSATSRPAITGSGQRQYTQYIPEEYPS